METLRNFQQLYLNSVLPFIERGDFYNAPIFMLIGPSGIGKSHVLKSIADILSEKTNHKFRTYYISASGDKSLSQVIYDQSSKQLHQIPLDISPDEYTVLFVDEVGNATPMFMDELQTLMSDKRIGNIYFDKLLIVLATNRPEHNHNVGDIPNTIWARTVSIDIKFDANEYVDYLGSICDSSGLFNIVASFVSGYRTFIEDQLNKTSSWNEKVFTPRMFERCVRMIDSIKEVKQSSNDSVSIGEFILESSFVKTFIRGAIGDAASVNFYSSIRNLINSDLTVKKLLKLDKEGIEEKFMTNVYCYGSVISDIIRGSNIIPTSVKVINHLRDNKCLNICMNFIRRIGLIISKDDKDKQFYQYLDSFFNNIIGNIDKYVENDADVSIIINSISTTLSIVEEYYNKR